MKKSQIAMETMAVYGFAILFVMVSIGALYYFGFSTEKQKPQFCTLQGGFICADFVVEETQIQVVAKNTKGATLQITGFAAADCASSSTSINLIPDAQTTLTFTSCSVASYYDGEINITYLNTESGITHTAKGEIKGVIGR